MSHYTAKIKAAAIKRMQPPQSQSIPLISQEMSIPQATLYSWRAQAKRQGQLMPNSQHNDWDAASKLNCIISTAALNQAELSTYCRETGLYPEQIDDWKTQLMAQLSSSPTRDEQRELKQLSHKIKQLQTELNRKDQALAESAALMVLSKKYRALLEDEAE
jgi:transposase-like protein